MRNQLGELPILRCVCFGFGCLLPIIAGCATPYGKLFGRFGYDDFRITNDVFEVSFSGNAATPPSVASRYVFRRAAEVCLESGFLHFTPLTQTDQSLYGSFNTASGSGQSHYYPGSNMAFSHGSASGISAPFRMPAISMRIKCFGVVPPKVEGVVDAKQFLMFNYPEALKDAEMSDAE